MLRAAIKAKSVADMADEFSIPVIAIEALPDQQSFLAARRAWLVEKERNFIESFGLVVSDKD